MKKRIKDMWVEALTSGEFKQGKGELVSNDEFCCLGVLCTLAMQDGVDLDVSITGSVHNTVHNAVKFDGKAQILPPKVMKWAGMKTSNGEIWFGDNHRTDLANENDNGRSFEDIAFAIEGFWKKL